MFRLMPFPVFNSAATTNSPRKQSNWDKFGVIPQTIHHVFFSVLPFKEWPWVHQPFQKPLGFKVVIVPPVCSAQGTRGSNAIKYKERDPEKISHTVPSNKSPPPPPHLCLFTLSLSKQPWTETFFFRRAGFLLKWF